MWPQYMCWTDNAHLEPKRHMSSKAPRVRSRVHRQSRAASASGWLFCSKGEYIVELVPGPYEVFFIILKPFGISGERLLWA
jgi:hypothetical protein